MLEDFFPTPPKLIAKMLEGIKITKLNTVLDIGAGRGDIADTINQRYANEIYQHTYNKNQRVDTDVIEIHPDFHYILKGKEYRLVCDDFLTFDTTKRYDLMIGNFPFSLGAEFLQKALYLLEQNGGMLRCLVNAETLRNPCTQTRMMVNFWLAKLGAEIEYLPGEFKHAERKSNVDCALIKVKVIKDNDFSILLDNLQQAPEYQAEMGRIEELVQSDFRLAMISYFKQECRLGAKLIEEWFAIKPYIKSRISKSKRDNNSEPMLELKIGDGYQKDTAPEQINRYLKRVRSKYWSALLSDKRFRDKYTTNILQSIDAKLSDLANYDFSLFNINELQREMDEKIQMGIEDAILKMFEEFSGKYYYNSTYDTGNIHYYNGWKTNKAHKVNKKIIIPMNGFSTWKFDRKDKIDDYYLKGKLHDMIKVFNYLAGKDNQVDPYYRPEREIKNANALQRFVLDFDYIAVKLYKKGSAHITFLNQDLLDKFNIFGSQRKNWLPPSYGKVAYDDMTEEEQQVIDDFQGREKYEEVLARKDYFLVDTSTLLLTGGTDHLLNGAA